MTNAPTTIRSDDVLDDIEHHYRVTAGPGAGKTYWLASHVRHVTQVSKRLTPCSKVGVISYTNVAVREILRRLETVAGAADVSTIHSFLYRNLVRPYLHLLKNSDGNDLVAHHLVDTHSEHFVNRRLLDDWLTACSQRQLLHSGRKASLDLLNTRLRSIAVRIAPDGSAFLAPCKTEARDVAIQALLTSDRLLEYKRLYWAHGNVDHEDVLYFAYRLLHEFPVLRRFLCARFPYLFIDEFQDTLPVQAAVVRWLADDGTTVGVIGDPEQAIYGFLDASATHFHEFRLTEHRTYQIQGNRRSTEAIVSFLNRVRTDGLQQTSTRSEPGGPPTIYGGSLTDALTHARSTSSHASTLLVLARNHKGVLRARMPAAASAGDPWDSIEDADVHRFRLLQNIASAVDLAQRRFYDLALQRLMQGISSRNGFRDPLGFNGNVHLTNRRSLALSLIEFMLTRHVEFLTMSALDVYNAVQQHVPTCLEGLTLPTVRAGKFRNAASACLYGDLIQSLKTAEETRLTRTIHQAKGGEAAAVFVVLDDDAADHVLNPIAGEEEHRITYVALSRARDELFIYCPDTSRLPEFQVIGARTLIVGNPTASNVPRRQASRRRTTPNA